MSKVLKRLLACLLATVVLAAGFIALNSTVAAAQEDSTTLQDITIRDQLIAAQESLLNVYRCRFQIDTQQVPEGCRNGQPSRGPTPPGTFSGTPTQSDVAVRDHLIANQESLLNVYRCRFQIDTQLVPGGCAPEPEPTLLDVHLFYCVPENSGLPRQNCKPRPNGSLILSAGFT